MENYKGTIWATWDPLAPSFCEYIGDLEPILGQAIAKPDGSEADIEVVRGVQKWILPSNWKFGHENFLTDGYHGIPTHRSVDLLTLSSSGQQGRHTHDHVARESYWFTISHHGSGRLTFRVNKENLPYTPTYPKAPAVEAYFRDAYERRQKQLGKMARLPSPAEPGGASIFPNTTMGNRVAVWNPNGPDQTEVWRWYTTYRDAPQEAKDLMRHYDISYAGPAGLTEQDDMENWNYAHPASKGVIARRYPYAYVQGVGLEKQGDPVLEEFGLVPNGTVTRLGEGSRRAPPSEQNARGAYRFWMQLMQAESWDELRVKGLWP